MKTYIKNCLASYLNFWAVLVYKRFKPYTVGVTGSSGKTTTKYFISQLLETAGKKTYISMSNLNTRYGLPLAILLVDNAPNSVFGWMVKAIQIPFRSVLLRKYPDYLVLEYAADLPGDIKKLASIFTPDITVVTSIGVAHMEIFKTEKGIIAEKSELMKAAREYVIVPEKVYEKIKDEKIDTRVVIAEKVPFLEFKDVKHGSKGTKLKIVLDSKEYEKTFAFDGEHNLSNLKISILAAYYAGAGSKLLDGIDKLIPLSGRGERFIGKNEIMVIDESYNANPESMFATLNNLNNIKYGRKVVILGEMKEIGPISDKAHIQIAKVAQEVADIAIGVGEGFRNCKLDKWYPSVRELKGEVEGIVNKGDVVLFKGSRSNALEEAITLFK